MVKKFYSNGYRDGVRLVEVANKFIDDFVCPYVKIDKDTKLISKLVKDNLMKNLIYKLEH